MASLVVSGDTSGAITIAAPAIAGTNTLTLPASTGTLVVTGGAQTIEFADGTVSAPSITNSGDTNTGIFFPAADTIAFTEGGAEAMRIDSSGNVGIGTSTATDGGVTITTNQTRDGSVNAKLALQSTGSNNYPFLLFSGCSSTTRYGGIIQTTSTSGNTAASNAASIQFPMDSATACHMSFWTNANIGTSNLAERMRITSTGDVCVNRTSSLGSVKFVVESDTTTYNPMTVSNTRSTAATDYQIIMYRNGSIVGSIQTSLSATSYVTSSDYRLKENVAPMTGALAKVAQLKPCTYTWKSTGADGQGFIAHELAEVVPDAVTGEKDAVNEDGSIKAQGIDTSFLVATLTAAIQELNAKVETQAAESQEQQQIINDLKARIETLENK